MIPAEDQKLVPFSELPIWVEWKHICEVCNFVMVSVYPITAERLECGQCGHMNQAGKLPKEPSKAELFVN